MNDNELLDASLFTLDEKCLPLNARSVGAVLLGYLFVAISASIVGLVTAWLVWAH